MPKTDGELNYLAKKFSWKKGPLTRGHINRMTADEANWQNRFNAEEFDRAMNMRIRLRQKTPAI